MSWKTKEGDPNIRRNTIPFTVTMAGGRQVVQNVIIDLNVKTGSYFLYQPGNLFTGFNEVLLLRSDKNQSNGLFERGLGPASESPPMGVDSKQYQRLVTTKLGDLADTSRKNYYLENGPQLGKELNIPGLRNVRNPNPAVASSENPLLPEASQIEGDQIGGNPETPAESPNPPIELKDDFDLASIAPELKSEQKEVVGKGKNIRYPVKSTGSDVIKFTAVNITRGNFRGDITKLVSFELPSQTYTPVDGSVFLPIQAPTNDQLGAEWGPDSINSIDAFVFGLSLASIEASKTEGVTIADVGKSAQEKIINAFKTQNQRITKSFAGAAAGVNNILARTDNVILNPNLELLFNSPQLRPFTFTFKLSARDSTEAGIIKQIIKYFKYHMVPRREKDAIFLRSPNVFAIQYLTPTLDSSGKVTGYRDHRGINKISGSTDSTLKACALTNCSVDYTPLGSYMTYNDQDKTMVSYTISLQFQELTPIYDTDYHDSWDHPIGY